MSINVIISKCKKHLEDTDKSGTIIESFLSEFLLITIHREYELFIKKSFIEKINKSKDDEIISYITDMTKRKTSINIEYLKETLEKFNKIYKDEFVKQLESREVNHYNSIISNRIIVAHKEPSYNIHKRFSCTYGMNSRKMFLKNFQFLYCII